MRACRVMIAASAAILAWAIAGRAARAEALGPGGLIVGQAVAVDGETLDFPAYRVRVWGIDAPRRGSWCFRSGEKWKPAAAATAAMSTCLKGKTITCRVQKREWHWLRTRYVAECWSDDGQDLGDCLVAGGWATDYTCYSDGYYRDRETEARNKGIGLWACDNGPPTRRWGRKGQGAPCESPTYKPSGPAPR